MSKTRDTGFLANVIQVHDTGVRIMSGSEMLMAISSSGQVTITGELSGSDAANSLLLDGTGSLAFTTTASFLAVSSSQQEVSASLLQVSASYISLSASYTTFSGSASTRITTISSSQQDISSSQQQISASLLNVISIFATTGSNSFRATQSITGSLTVTGQIIAQTLNVQQVTSSIIYSSGSNVFGCDLNSRQTFTGSVLITGSLTIAGASSATSYSAPTIFGSTIACSPIGCFATSCATAFIGGTICSTIGTFTNSAGQPSVNVRSSDNNFSLISILGNQTGDVNWLLMSGYPVAGDFTIRQSDVVNALTIKKTNGIACFASKICAPALTTCNLRVSDETTFGLRICTGPSVYPIIIADGGQSMGFYTCESGGSFAERMKISQTGIITIGCQVCLGNGSSSPVNPNKGIYLSNNGITALIIRDSTNCSEFTTQVGSTGAIIGTLTNHDLLIYTCNAERGRICANGKTRFLACGYGSYIFGNPNVSDDGTFIIGSVVGGTPLSLTDGFNAHTYFRFCSGQSVIESDGTMKFMTAGSINSLILAGTTGIACFSTTNAMIPPVGTTAQRPTATTGMMRYNSTFNLMEFYNGTSWVQMGSGDLATAQCINNTSMCHSVYQASGTLGLQGQGSGCISLYGAAAPSMAISNTGNQFATHGGHCGASDYPGYWAVHLGGARAANQLKVWIHANSWGYFELQGSNNSGNASGFNQSGNWTTLSFLCSNNSNCQNMGGNASGCTDGTVFSFWYTNDVPFAAYRIKVLDSSRQTQSLGTTYGGSAGYVWQLNRV